MVYLYRYSLVSDVLRAWSAGVQFLQAIVWRYSIATVEINMFKLWVAILIMLSAVVHLSGEVSRPFYPTILFAMVLGAAAREGIAKLDHTIVNWVSNAGKDEQSVV